MTANELPRFAIAAVPVGTLLFLAFRPKPKLPPPVVEDRPDEPYRVYTTEFDAVVHGSEIGDRLAMLVPDRTRGQLDTTDFDWLGQIASAAKYTVEAEKGLAAKSHNPPALEHTAVMLLVDQSGSMRGMPMAWVAAGVRRFSEELGQAGAAVQVAGFTTAGWKGGFARLKWVEDGRPARPGRLCALLHIIYKSFDEESWAEGSWRAMLDPNILRENIDGEALLWAADELRARPEARKMLIVVSDGAPVDDSTLLENGAGILVRHVRKVVADVGNAGDIDLRAIGIGYAVDQYYGHSVGLNVGGDFISTAWDLLRSGPPD